MWWSIHLEGGPRRVNHAAAAVGDRIYSFGGYCTGENFQIVRPIEVYILNTVTLRWSVLPQPKPNDLDALDWPFKRYGHTVCVYKDKIYLFGGRNDTDACNIVYCFDPETLKWSIPEVRGDRPPPRDGHTACVIRDSMFIFSGYNTEFPHFNSDVYRLDFTTMAWSAPQCTGAIPLASDFHTATAIGDLMYVFGGRSEGTEHGGIELSHEFYSDVLSVLDTTTMTWFQPLPRDQGDAPHPPGRRSHAAINLNNKLLLFGGFQGNSEEHKNDLWLFDPSNLTWTELHPHGKGPNPRRRMALCLVGDQVFLFGGTSNYKGPKIHYSEEQLAVIPQQLKDASLIDHSDLYVLELAPSLRNLCLMKVIEQKLDVTRLPRALLIDLERMTTDNNISSPLITLPLG